MRYSIVLLLITLSFGSISQDRPIEKIFKNIQDIDRKYWKRGSASEFRFTKPEEEISKAEEYAIQVEKLDVLTGLTRQEEISRDIMLMILEDHINSVKFKEYFLVFNAEGGFYGRPLFAINNRPFRKVEDYENYLKWMKSFTKYLEFNIGLLKQGIEENIVRPKVIVSNNIKLLEPWLTTDFKENPFARPFLQMPSALSDTETLALFDRGKEVVENEVVPAYQAVKDFLVKEYLPAAPEKEGISNIANGKEFYETKIRFFTTMDMSPDSVFALGIQEVKRIRSQMQGIIDELEFDGDFDEFIEFLRTDPQFFAKTPQELLNYAAWLSKKAEGQLPRLFSNLYSLPFTVAPVPDEIAPTYTGGRYVPGSREGDRPGTYWVNTYDLPSRTLYTIPALTLHEAVPGHHLDYGVRSELSDIPDFRKRYYISAFGEGWGLYAEYLGEEMGMYSTPYEMFGRYTYEMWRACRLVVDVGIHWKGWNRQEAVDFLAGNSALSLHEVNTEIDRYIGWPGQAVSYKIGEITIRSLREKAEFALGDKFDIQEFHRVILMNGSVPLPILREEVERYISETSGLGEEK